MNLHRGRRCLWILFFVGKLSLIIICSLPQPSLTFLHNAETLRNSSSTQTANFPPTVRLFYSKCQNRLKSLMLMTSHRFSPHCSLLQQCSFSVVNLFDHQLSGPPMPKFRCDIVITSYLSRCTACYRTLCYACRYLNSTLLIGECKLQKGVCKPMDYSTSKQSSTVLVSKCNITEIVIVVQ